MPPQRRRPAATKPAEPQPEAPARHAKADGPICGECWPNGWRDGSTNAGCTHGSWKR